MLTIPQPLILALCLALTSAPACADDFMIAAAPGGVAMAQSRQDCDIAPGSASARVIYHDGQSAPISVPVDSRALVSDGAGSEASPESGGSGGSAPAAAVSLPSAEPSVPQRPRGGGLRWQSVLPGSIK